MSPDPQRAKKIVAAVTAVMHHLAEEAALAAAREAATLPAAPPAVPVWAVAGRQDAMLYRSLWQRRIAKSW